MSAEQLTPDGRRRAGRPPLRVQAQATGPAVPDCPRRRGYRSAQRRAAYGRVHGAVSPGRGRAGIRGPRAHGHGGGIAARSLSLGPLRPAGPAAVVSVRRDGEPAAHICDADDHCRRQVAGVARGARARALVVGQPRHQCHVERFLAERRVHHVRRVAHHGSALRHADRRDAAGAGAARPARTRSPASADRPHRTRSCG